MVFLITLLSIYYGFVFNYPIIDKIYILSDNQSVFYFLSPLVLTFAFIIIFSILALPYLFKAIQIPLLITSALAFYASIKYNVMFDYSMIENIFETDTGEAFTYINFGSISYFIFLGLLPALIVFKTKITYAKSITREIINRLLLVIVAVVGILFIAFFYYKDYASIGRNNSYLNKMINPAHAYNSYKYLKITYLTKELAYKKIGQDASLENSSNDKPTLMILVVGETARSQNIFYNGYARNTNPHTQDMGIISFQDVSSCGTATAHSLPCMFSNMNRSNYDKNRAITQDNALDVISHAGVDMLWIENDGGDKRVADNFSKIEIAAEDSPELCDAGSCYDEVLLQNLDEKIQKNKGNQLIALHIKGSHGPTYWQRYPESKARFTPACNQSDIEHCSDQEIVNVYDNTLVYTDYIIAQTIKKLTEYSKQYNVALMYISDHGESLGENGLYLHGAPYMIAPEEQTQVPWFMWLGNGYAAAKGIDKQCLLDKANNDTFSHDNLFHTLLGFYGVDSTAKDSQLDIIASCKQSISNIAKTKSVDPEIN
ncbi:phosphatidylethanolamine:Kdo2-lipid A phosphoethanolamine transferase [Psychromonas ingrahamii 37]|uniref:Phosphatidylethanolamine:Kdo2-lipid A phosphoethanolamine transferase n=2 Tax=Psychromonas ingrahamii TaxID=357794 RepID=A1SUV6_PSYIN|nr:phosphatidylethanolamine:Kdo2-lipid A phosphoethanolamine transferase [Psychromonas ingrahamii 37]